MIDKAIDRHNKTATIISAILGSILLAFYSHGVLSLVGRAQAAATPLVVQGQRRQELPHGVQLSLVERRLWEADAVGSNPITPIAYT